MKKTRPIVWHKKMGKMLQAKVLKSGLTPGPDAKTQRPLEKREDDPILKKKKIFAEKLLKQIRQAVEKSS